MKKIICLITCFLSFNLVAQDAWVSPLDQYLDAILSRIPDSVFPPEYKEELKQLVDGEITQRDRELIDEVIERTEEEIRKAQEEGEGDATPNLNLVREAQQTIDEANEAQRRRVEEIDSIEEQ